MRYEIIDNISFTNRENVTVNIKDFREYPDYTTFVALKIKQGDRIDEIASRLEVYGNEAEADSYKIVDNNIIKLFENDFDLTKLLKLDISL